MHWFQERAQRVGNCHVQFFVPAVDRDGIPVPEGQDFWVHQCLTVMAQNFGGATAFPGKGVWRDDERGGNLVFEDTVVVFSYVGEDDLKGPAGEALFNFAMRLGGSTNQGEVGIYVDGEYFGFKSFNERDDSREEATP